MTMTFDIPSDVQRDVADIPWLDLRVALYLQHEAKLEALRRQRHSAEARAIAERAVIQAQRDQKAGFDWDSSFGHPEAAASGHHLETLSLKRAMIEQENAEGAENERTAAGIPFTREVKSKWALFCVGGY